MSGVPSVGLTASAVLREAPSEWDRRKFVLAIDATSTAALKPAIEQFFAEPGLNRLTGDTAYMTAQGLSCLITARKRNIGEILLLLRVEVWLRRDWLALPAILAGVSAVLFVAWRLALERYKSGRSARWQGAD